MKWWNRGWNPVNGCTKCSEGCKNCCAEKLVERRKKSEKNISFDIRINQKQLNKKQGEEKEFICVGSQSDIFHPFVSEKNLDDIFEKIEYYNNKFYAVLTKRSAYMKEYFINNESNSEYENVIFGVSVENTKRLYRIDDLIDTPKIKYRFVCLEPLLEEVDIKKYLATGKIDWVVVGPETGEEARYCDIKWIESIVKQCKEFNIPVFVNNINIEESKELSSYPKDKLMEFFKDFKP